MSHCLTSIAALALVCVGLVDGVEVGGQADLDCAHLCDERADRSVCANTCGERPFTRSHSESKEFSAVFSRFPRRLPFVSHRLTDCQFRGCYQGPG